MVNSFVDHFWDADWDGTVGYDTLLTKLKDGKKLYEAFSEFVRNKAKIEDEYGKNLIKMAQIAAGNDEMGTLKASWDAIKKETENIGLIHCELSKQLNSLVETNIKFREKQKLQRSEVDDFMKKEQKEKKVCHENMLKAKRLYEQRCKEADGADEMYHAKTSYTPKEEEKLKRNYLKCKTAVDAADSAYLHSVKLLEAVREKYVLSMEDACTRFQTIEEERIQFLRNEMWLYANHGSAQAVNIGEKYEDCRTVLEKCSESYDIQLFINMYNTGSKRPAPIAYQNYYHKVDPHHADFNNMNIDEDRDPSVTQSSTDLASSKPPPTPSPLGNRHIHTATNPQQLISRAGQQAHSSTPNLVVSHDHEHDTNQFVQTADEYPPRLIQIDDNLPPSLSNIRTNSSGGVLAQAAFAYQSQSERELSLSPGDVIEVKRFVDDTWGLGMLHGKYGAFPLEFVDIVQ